MLCASGGGGERAPQTPLDPQGGEGRDLLAAPGVRREGFWGEGESEEPGVALLLES